MSTETSPSIYQLMAEVQKDIGAVGRNRTNTHHKYNYRGIDDLMNAVHASFVKHNVFCVPEVIVHDVLEKKVALLVRYTFFGPDGTNVSCVVAAEGADTQDKSTSKALSAAYKYAIMQTFSVPTDDIEDSDGDGPVQDEPRREPRRESRREPQAREEEGVPEELVLARKSFLDAFNRAVHGKDEAKAEFKRRFSEKNGVDFTLEVITLRNAEAFIRAANEVVNEIIAKEAGMEVTNV